MKIFCFGSDYPPTGGGISTYTREWLLALAEEKDIRVRAVIFGNKEPRRDKVGGVIEIETLRSVNFFYVGFRILQDMIRYRHYDVFHAFNLFPVGFWTVLWGKILGKKTALSFYGSDACDIRTSKKVVMLQKWTLQNVTFPITISESTKKRVEVRYGFKNLKIHVIHPILPRFEKGEPEDIRAKFGFGLDDFVVLSLGRLVKRKGVELLIQAISKISDPKVKLLIVGKGPERETYEKLVADLNVGNRVIFAGKAPVLAPYYQACDVYSLVSYVIEEEGDVEGFGIVLLEAQSYKKPVIGSQSGGIPETFIDGKTGILVPEKDVEVIARAIMKLKTDKALYEEMSNNTTAFLRERFGKENTVRKYLKLIST